MTDTAPEAPEGYRRVSRDIPEAVIDYFHTITGIRFEGAQLVSAGYGYDELLEDEVVDIMIMIKPKAGTNIIPPE